MWCRLVALVALVAAPAGHAGFLPPQSQILSDMVLVNSRFTNEWPTSGCSSCLPGSHAGNTWTRGVYFEGALALYRINHDVGISNYAVNWGSFLAGSWLDPIPATRCRTTTWPARVTSSCISWIPPRPSG